MTSRYSVQYSGADGSRLQILPHIGTGRDLATMLADQANGVFDPGQVALLAAERRIFQADADMTAARHGLTDQRPRLQAPLSATRPRPCA